MDLLQLKSFWILSPTAQIILIVALFVLTAIFQYLEVKKTGKMFNNYPVRVSILFAPIFEEIIFRGFILYGLTTIYPITLAVIISSLLFGLWHFKNIFYETKLGLTYQMLYAGLIFGPIMAVAVIQSGTVWLAVILHYLNNIIAPFLMKYVKSFSKCSILQI